MKSEYNQPDRYNGFLLKSALKWGCHDPGEAGGPHQIIQTLVYRPGGGTRIKLFAFNGQYGYCLDLRFKKEWSLYGPFLGFSDPYPSQAAALDAAVADVIRAAKNHEDAAVVKWARSLIAPRQLTFFSLPDREPQPCK